MTKKRERGRRGEGTVEQIGDQFRAVVSTTSGGKRRRVKGPLCPTVKAALAWKRQHLTAHANGRTSTAGKLTLAGWLDRWLALRQPNIEPRTYRAYAGRVRLHIKPSMGKLSIASLRPVDIEQRLAAMAAAGHTPSERQKVGRVLRTALRHAQRMGVIERDPMAGIKLPSPRSPEKTCLSGDQIRQLLAVAHADRLAPMLRLWFDCGARPGEIYGLRWDDLDQAAGTLFIRRTLENLDGKLRVKPTKTARSNRKLPLAKSTLAALDAHRAAMCDEGRDVDTGPMFVGIDGGMMRESRVGKWLHKLLDKAGLPRTRPYDIRHSSATLLLSAGVDIKTVSERLGHEDVAMTLRTYVHSLPSLQKRAADMVDSLLGPTVAPNPPPAGEGDTDVTD